MGLKKIQNNMRAWWNKKVSGTYHPFTCFLPPQTGIISRLILKLLFTGIQMDPQQTDLPHQSEKDRIIIYVNKYKSYFEYFFFYMRFRHEGLVYPGIGLDYRLIIWQPLMRLFKIILSHFNYFIKHLALPDPYKSGYIRDKLMAGNAALVSLVEEKGFYRRFVQSKPDPLHYLIEIQKRIDRPIYFYPQLMLFGKAPEKTRLTFIDMLFGTNENPGRIRRLLALIKNPKSIFIESSEPLCLRQFLARPEIAKLSSKNQAVALRRHLLDQLNRHRQSITGPMLKSRLEIIEELLTRQDVQKFIADYARETNVSIHQAHKQAAAYLNEIASNYNLKMIRIFDVVLRWMFRNIFEGMVIDYSGLDRVKRISRNAPLVLVPCHKSHLDYLILSYVFFNNNMPCPLIAAGKNLSFWPLGPIFRGGGAFFLRRTFKGEKLYPKVFAAYIQKIIDEGFYVEFFPEGGRSRTGKLLTPKIGLLSFILEAYQNIRWSDMIFVPIYIGYDRVLEEKAYIHELEGGKKAPENLKNVVKARKFLKRKYGKIYLNFNAPISLRHYLKQYDPELTQPIIDPKNTSLHLGRRLIAAINQVTVVTPHSVLASAILNCGQKRFYYNQLFHLVETYMDYLLNQGANLSDTLIIDRNSAFTHVLETFVQNKMLEKSTTELSTASESNPLFKISDNRRPGFEYYKNNCVICFVPGAFTAMSILYTDAFQFSASELHEGYEFLQDLFANEFIFENELPVSHIVRKTLKSFIDDAILMPHPTLPETYNITSAGYRKLYMFAAFLCPFFDSYWVVLNYMMRYTKQPVFEVKDYIKKIQGLGNRMYKRNEITRKEALTKINYQNAVTRFSDKGLTHPETDPEAFEFYIEKLQTYRKYLQDKMPLLS
ncbi:MAG: 1-acyl-sn-glycerol-3-phosphate acyltransferase [Desulfobacterales bacterium]|nr:1-acyl-sn-glycerol-3-phosphate acyltransferase [Desulfobacterales bacterium]